MFGSKPDIGRRIGPSQHTGAHTGIIVVFGGADNRYPMALCHKRMNIGKGHHMGMTTADKYQMFSHG
jgi:hypothetical protein